MLNQNEILVQEEFKLNNIHFNCVFKTDWNESIMQDFFDATGNHDHNLHLNCNFHLPSYNYLKLYNQYYSNNNKISIHQLQLY